jgi:small-conductance mechanosensitive channel
VLALLAGLIFGFKLLQMVLRRVLKGRISEQTRMLLKKMVAYLGFVVISIVLADALGFNVATILGVAGIAGIAIGFAAQTSISNVISGLFLISEKPFAIGDVITTNEVTGIVLSIDMLSVKIKTFDNTFVRIPNESIIKSKVINVTRYPIRRLDISLSVSYADDLRRVLQVLQEVAEANQFGLRNPEPFLMVKQFAASGIEVLLGVWFEKTEYVELKNSLMIEIQKRFAQENITIPFPQLDVHVDRETMVSS